MWAELQDLFYSKSSFKKHLKSHFTEISYVELELDSYFYFLFIYLFIHLFIYFYCDLSLPPASSTSTLDVFDVLNRMCK